MVNRGFWIKKIEEAWKLRSVIWLTGVRRTGKTFLSKSLHGVRYFDCELPSMRREMDDPEEFLRRQKQGRIVIDEIHRLRNPSELLKIAADYYPNLKVLATGSSSLSASAKFKDTLTGRKTVLWLTPMILEDCRDFGNEDLSHRFLRGGLPPFFMSEDSSEREFQGWMDDYWAKDVQDLFRLERKDSFQKCVELTLMRSGGIFDAVSLSNLCEVSYGTIKNYMQVIEETYVGHLIRPYSERKQTEIVSRPKVYGFDTGFVCCFRGWDRLRREDMGVLWEHFVLNELHARLQSHRINYWRDKMGHEIDFILERRGSPPLAIECKWSSKDFDPKSFIIFHKKYTRSPCFVVAQDVEKSFGRSYGDLSVEFVSLSSLVHIALR